jgi:hypothetical protein
VEPAGAVYDAGSLEAAVADGTLVELRGLLRPAEDIALYRAEMAAWPGPGGLRDWQETQRDWVAANDDCRRDILEKLYDEGPLPSSDLLTRRWCRGGRAGGTTTATSGCCWAS